ncbi:hypothetical protein FS749_014373 [Ceratobasidium sp. UAMH 11750]|nr:hypothetical protein FS749_014373 [Ceratobasidium sp. UAMH 11750]
MRSYTCFSLFLSFLAIFSFALAEPVPVDDLAARSTSDISPVSGSFEQHHEVDVGTLAKASAKLTCPASTGLCSNDPGTCCPLGGRCCGKKKCCKKGCWCYGKGCCPTSYNGCDGKGCCAKGWNCCKGGSCCKKGYYCYKSNRYNGQIRCCPNGKVCA